MSPNSHGLYAIQNFFPAVILVIIGTYLTFIALSVVVPVLMHGCYDFLAFTQESDSRFTLLFYAYLVALYVFGIRRVNRSSRDDRRVTRETVFDYFRRMQYPMPPQYRDRDDDFWR